MGAPVASFLDKMEEIRLEANRHFFLGLFEYEAHFAKYEKGDFYQNTSIASKAMKTAV